MTENKRESTSTQAASNNYLNLMKKPDIIVPSGISQTQNINANSYFNNLQRLSICPNPYFGKRATQPIFVPNPNLLYSPYISAYPSYMYHNVYFQVPQNYQTTLRSIILNNNLNLVEYLCNESASTTFIKLLKSTSNEEIQLLIDQILIKFWNYFNILLVNVHGSKALTTVYSYLSNDHKLSIWKKITEVIPIIIEDDLSLSSFHFLYNI